MSFLTTLAKVKRALRIADAVTDYDTFIGELITAAHALILGDIGGGLSSDDSSTSYTSYFDVDEGGRNSLRLPKWPVTGITEVRTGTNYGDGGTVLQSVDYAYTEEGTLRLQQTGAMWPFGRRNVKVTWTAGITSGSVHETALELAERLTVVAMFKGSGMIGLSSEKIGSYAYTKGKDSDSLYPPMAAAIISRYRSVLPPDTSIFWEQPCVSSAMFA